jgi:hypothetical protein
MRYPIAIEQGGDDQALKMPNFYWAFLFLAIAAD